MPLCMSFSLTPAHCLCDSLCNLFFLRSANLGQIHALRHELLQDLVYESFVDVARVKLRGTQQRAQARLMLYGTRWHHRP